MATPIPPFLPQETKFSCAAACLRMVSAALGVIKPEAELRALCDCTIFGTSAVELLYAAHALGFVQSRKYSLSLAELKDFLAQDYFPIVFVVLTPGRQTQDVHAVVVIGMSAAEIVVLDPNQGERRWLLAEFAEMWAPMRNVAVIVAK